MKNLVISIALALLILVLMLFLGYLSEILLGYEGLSVLVAVLTALLVLPLIYFLVRKGRPDAESRL
jgi:hypothetical protein